MKKLSFILLVILPFFSNGQEPAHTIEIGDTDFLYDGKPMVIRCGEMHFARIPREYWGQRLRMAHAMGLNTICAYLFWNYHELYEGKFNWDGMADAAEFCRLAQEEGLHVILRPGPYSCAEWELGGIPWWLLKNDDIALRTQDPVYLEACRRYIMEMGKQLAPLQVTQGGPILMVQVENEYGSYGNDREYIGKLRDYLAEAGFEVPFFTCDGPVQLKNDVRDDIFCVVNFGSDPEECFQALREVRPTGPLMNGEYYPGWFDSWGKPHHTGSVERVKEEIRWMLDHRASFSIYMVHGGTSFGTWSGANCPPFSPQTSSYDYDAPISEAGWATPKYHELRELLSSYLEEGETLPDVPAPNRVITIPGFTLRESAPILENLPAPVHNATPLTFEALDQPFGMVLYRTAIPAGSACQVDITELHDFALVYMDGLHVATLDRRKGQETFDLPARTDLVTLEILVEAMGRVNYGRYLHDRKGITEKVEMITGKDTTEVTGWDMFRIPLGEDIGIELKYQKDALSGPAFYKGSFHLDDIGDSFLDLSQWGKGLVWVNGHCLGRYWSIGPTQTMYLPGPWLQKGKNEVVVLDILGPDSPFLQGLTMPVLDSLDTAEIIKPNRTPNQKLDISGYSPVTSGTFENGTQWQAVTFATQEGRYFCLEALSEVNGQPYTTAAEIILLDQNGDPVPRENWKIVYADSEEIPSEDGRANNIYDQQFTTFWHTEWSEESPGHPHQVVIDLGQPVVISGIQYLPRQDSPNGRIKDYRIYISQALLKGL
jgi:beta-galactosidase